MRVRKRRSNDRSKTDLVELARDWIVPRFRKVAGQLQVFVFLRPKTTAAIGVACVLIAFAVRWAGRAVGEYRDKRHEAKLLERMMDDVRAGHQRVRSRIMPENTDESADYRGVFETMRDSAQPPVATERPPTSESKP